jgi:hypothetical protein
VNIATNAFKRNENPCYAQSFVRDELPDNCAIHNSKNSPKSFSANNGNSRISPVTLGGKFLRKKSPIDPRLADLVAAMMGLGAKPM